MGFQEKYLWYGADALCKDSWQHGLLIALILEVGVLSKDSFVPLCRPVKDEMEMAYLLTPVPPPPPAVLHPRFTTARTSSTAVGRG